MLLKNWVSCNTHTDLQIPGKKIVIIIQRMQEVVGKVLKFSKTALMFKSQLAIVVTAERVSAGRCINRPAVELTRASTCTHKPINRRKPCTRPLRDIHTWGP